MKNLTALVACATITACTLSVSSRADTILEPRSVTVSFDDLDTNSSRGAEVLYRRIKVAAESVCSDLGPARSLALLSRYASCIQTAIGNAVAKVDRPALSEYAAARAIPGAPIKVKVARNN
jgi:UrcA family protein